MAVINLIKTFDSVKRESYWRIPFILGSSLKFRQILQLLHDDTSGTVLNNNGPGETIKSTKGVKKGCIVDLTLFSIYDRVIFQLVTDKIPNSAKIIYRTKGGKFNLSRLSENTKVSTTSVLKCSYAGDNQTKSEDDFQQILGAFKEAHQSTELNINASKTQIINQPEQSSNTASPAVIVNGTNLKHIFFPI